MTRLSQTVTVRGATYRVVFAGPTGTGKFFGRRRWLLRADDGTHHEVYGKAVTANAAIAPADPAFWARHGYPIPEEGPTP